MSFDLARAEFAAESTPARPRSSTAKPYSQTAFAFATAPDAGKEGTDAGVAQQAPAPPAPAPTATPTRASQDVAITNVMGPKDRGRGGYDWKVWFSVGKAAANDGWVIQEYDGDADRRKADGKSDAHKAYHYWEAWELKKGKTVTIWQDGKLDDNDDEYWWDPEPEKTKGTNSVKGKVKFYEGALPGDFKKENPDTIAHILPSTTKKPPFWDGAGTRHDLTATWDDTGSKPSSKVTAVAGSTVIEGKP